MIISSWWDLCLTVNWTVHKVLTWEDFTSLCWTLTVDQSLFSNWNKLTFACQFLHNSGSKWLILCHEQVSQLLSTRMGQYFLRHPAFAQTLLFFAAFAVLPVALFLAFAIVTFIISAAGFVFFQGRCNCLSILMLQLSSLVARQPPSWHLPPPGFLLFVGGLSLLCVLVGVALFSGVISLIFSVFYFVISSIFRHQQLTKVRRQYGQNHAKIPTVTSFSWLYLLPLTAQSPWEGERNVKAGWGSVMEPYLSTRLWSALLNYSWMHLK